MALRLRSFALALGTLLIAFPAAAATADGELSGSVWADIDADGIRADTENGVAGIAVLLLRRADGQDDEAADQDDDTADQASQVDQTTTGPDGTYRFEELTPGSYVVRFVLPEGQSPDELLFFTRQNAGGDDRVDSDADPFTGRSDPLSFRGDPVANTDAGLLGPDQTRVIDGIVWEDRNDDGLDDAEPLMDGVSVNLLRETPARDRGKRRDKRAGQGGGGSTFETVDTTTSSAGGPDGPGYAFYVPPSMARYVVEVVTPDSHVTALRDQDPTDARDSDVDPDTGRSDPLVADQDHVIDIGLVPYSAIGDYAWLDADGDGLQDPEEEGLEDVIVILERLFFQDPDDPGDDAGTWDILGLEFTDSGGFYSFGGLLPGTYRLRFIPRAGYGYTRFQEGDDRTIDSDAMPDSGLTPEIDLPDDAGPPSEAAIDRILEAGERAQAERDAGRGDAPPAGADGQGANGPGASIGVPSLYADQWDAGFIRGDGSAVVTVAGDRRPVVCATGKRARDPEVTITDVHVYRLPNGDHVFLVQLGKGLAKGYSFAVVLYIRTPLGTLMFLWEIHDKASRIGQADPGTGQLIGEDGDGVRIVNLRDRGIVAFLVEAGLIPGDSDVFQVQSFHTSAEGRMTICDRIQTSSLPRSQE